MEERGDMIQVQRHKRPQGSWITCFTGSTASYNISTKQEITLFRANAWSQHQQGSHSDKRGRGRRMYERRTKKKKKQPTESEKEETARPAGSWGQTPQEKKHNNNWPTSCLKVGKVSMTPLPHGKMLYLKTKKNIYCPRVSYSLGLISQQPLKTRCLQDR